MRHLAGARDRPTICMVLGMADLTFHNAARVVWFDQFKAIGTAMLFRAREMQFESRMAVALALWLNGPCGDLLGSRLGGLADRRLGGRQFCHTFRMFLRLSAGSRLLSGCSEVRGRRILPGEQGQHGNPNRQYELADLPPIHPGRPRPE